MATKRVGVKKSGEGSITEMEINNTTTAADVLRSVNCPTDGDFFVSLAAGEPPFGLTELVFDRVKSTLEMDLPDKRFMASLDAQAAHAG